MKTKVCVVGSGAGAGPIIWELTKAGHDVIVLEKGPWIKTDQITKDEMVTTRRDVYTPNLRDERHIREEPKGDGWVQKSTFDTGLSMWRGSAVGGSSNFMSGYFHRLKPKDFKLLSEYGEIEGANVVDWPITYDELEPYYTKVESVIGISGKVVQHAHMEPRSTPDYPYPPLGENLIASKLEEAAKRLNYELVPVPRAIISRAKDHRKACYYSNFCGSYGCSSDAKGSARAALLTEAAQLENCTILPNSKVFRFETNGQKKITKAWYYDSEEKQQSIEADLFVIACQATETSRLLLMSANDEYPNGLANTSGEVGKNLLFSSGGYGSGNMMYSDMSAEEAEQIKLPGLFINRALNDWYEVDTAQFGGKAKGGVVDFVWDHANPVSRAIRQKKDAKGNLVYGSALKRKIKSYFTDQRRLKFEVFTDWLPNDDCNVSLARQTKDKWGDPVSKIRLGTHKRDYEIGKYIAERSAELLREVGAKNIKWGGSTGAPANLQAGGCRFGNDPKTSVLDKNCKAHDVDNLYVTDGSFMPTGGSVPYTWTIYANSFRVADHLLEVLK